MLDWQLIQKCHAHVALWYWPVLWIYLIRLEATMAQARAEGRKGFMWHLMPNGVIFITHMDASDAERAARGELPRDFDRTPWTRLEPVEPGPSGAGLWLAPHCTLTAPSLAPCRTLTGPGLASLHPP